MGKVEHTEKSVHLFGICVVIPAVKRQNKKRSCKDVTIKWISTKENMRIALDCSGSKQCSSMDSRITEMQEFL